MAHHTHGTGEFTRAQLRSCPESVVFEPGALVFHPENVSLGDNVYVGHYAILKGYYRNELVIGSGTWIGQAAFLHAAGGIHIGSDGLGANVGASRPARDKPTAVFAHSPDGRIRRSSGARGHSPPARLRRPSKPRPPPCTSIPTP
jgi:hypothetical protein